MNSLIPEDLEWCKGISGQLSFYSSSPLLGQSQLYLSFTENPSDAKKLIEKDLLKVTEISKRQSQDPNLDLIL